jgi:hypothetical protein
MAIKDLFDTAKRQLGLASPTTGSTQTPRDAVRLSNPWHSVAIQPGPKRCKAAGRLLGHRFLSREAPGLPLADCDETACTCRYRHHDDRRLDRVPFDRDGLPLTHPGRRASD